MHNWIQDLWNQTREQKEKRVETREEKSSSRSFFARPRLPLWRASVSTADSDVRDASLGDSDGRRASGSFDATTPADELLASDSLRHDADDKKGAIARLAATPTTEFREVGLEVP